METQPDLVATLREELQGYYFTLTTLNKLDPIEVFETLSAVSSRVSEVREIVASTDTKRNAAFRIRTIDPLLEEVDRQFKFHSRIVAIREHEAQLAKY